MKRFLQNLGKVLWVAAAVAACLSSCTKGFDDYSYKDRKDYKADSTFFRQPCFVSGNIPDEVSSVLFKAFPVRGDSDNADVLIITSEELAANPAAFSDALDKNVILVVYNPDQAKIRTSLGSMIPAVNEWDLSGLDFFGVNRSSESCFVAKSPEVRYEEVLPLVKWIGEVYPLPDAAENILDFKLVSSSVSYELKDEEITHVILSSIDRLSGKGNITINLNVCPAHGFGDSAEDGYDYYIVQSQLSVESNSMYSGNFIKKHGGVKARICGFYLKRLKYDLTLTNADGSVAGEFCTVPLPATVAGSTTYSDAFNFNVSGCLSGTADGSMVGAGLSYSKSVENTIPDVSLFNNHHDNVVSYELSMGNLPHYLSKIAISDPPQSAVSTLDINSSWVWRVKVPDGSPNIYKVSFNIRDLVYGASYMYSSSADYHDLEFAIPDASGFMFLPSPGRVATGKVSIMCPSGVLDYVSLVSQETSKEYRKTDDYDVFDFVVPEGKYEVRFGLKGADYVYDKIIDVPRCGNVALNTEYGFIEAA